SRAIWSGDPPTINFGTHPTAAPRRRSTPRRPPEPAAPVPAPLALDALDLAPDAVRARPAWARGQGHPSYLWPEVAPAEWRDALAALGEAVRTLLAGAERVELAPRQSPGAIGVAAFTSGTGPLLGHWVEAGRL